MKKLWYLFIFLILLVADQVTKLLAYNFLREKSDFPIIRNVFELRYVENRGAAFGLLQGKIWIFIIITLITMFIVGYLFVKLPYTKRYSPLKLTLVVLSAGTLGNLIDRLFRGYVVDFLYFKPINFPVFNVADVYLTCAAAVLVIMLLFVYREDEVFK